MTATSGSTAGLAAALRSAPVAITIGIAGWAIVAYVLLGQAAKPDGQFGIDFADYHAAATRMAAGDSPYAPDMLEGPIPSQGQDRYRYPPVFAALLIPLTGLSAATAAAVWLAIGLAATLLAVVLPVVRPVWRGGWTPVLWAIALAGWFFPVLDGLLKGNVDGLIALAAAVLLVGSSGSGGVATGAGGVLKLTPILGAVPLARRSIRSLGVLGVTILVLVVPTMVLWPQAWRDYAVVLPNLVAGSSSGAGGLAPAALLEASGTSLSGLAPGLRTLTLIGVAVALVASWWLAGPRGVERTDRDVARRGPADRRRRAPAAGSDLVPLPVRAAAVHGPWLGQVGRSGSGGDPRRDRPHRPRPRLDPARDHRGDADRRGAAGSVVGSRGDRSPRGGLGSYGSRSQASAGRRATRPSRPRRRATSRPR